MWTQSLNPNCRLLFQMYIFKANVSKHPAELLHISLFSKWLLSMIKRAMWGAYSWELLEGCIVLFAKSLLQILYQLNTYKTNVREYSPGEFHDDNHDQLLTW